MSRRAKKFRTRECAEFFTFSLFTLHFSLNPPRDFSREEIREKREERKENVSFRYGKKQF